MLTLARKFNQSIVLETSDGPVTIIVGKFTGGQIKLVFDAPQAVRILRGELMRKESGDV